MLLIIVMAGLRKNNLCTLALKHSKYWIRNWKAAWDQQTSKPLLWLPDICTDTHIRTIKSVFKLRRRQSKCTQSVYYFLRVLISLENGDASKAGDYFTASRLWQTSRKKGSAGNEDQWSRKQGVFYPIRILGESDVCEDTWRVCFDNFKPKQMLPMTGANQTEAAYRFERHF